MHISLKALVIESQPAVASIVSDVLRRAGFSKATVVPSCSVALDVEAGFDLALVDLRDWISGVEAFDAFAARHKLGGAIFGLMASSVDRAIISAARAAPCHFVILKPFGPDELRHKLSSHINLPRKPALPSRSAPESPTRMPSRPEPIVVVGDIALL